MNDTTMIRITPEVRERLRELIKQLPDTAGKTYDNAIRRQVNLELQSETRGRPVEDLTTL